MSTPTPQSPAPVPSPPEDPAVAALTGPYWDRLRQLKRVRITCPPASGIVVSRQPGRDPQPPPPASQ